MIDLYGYDTLIEKFLKHEISVSEFEKVYLNKFKKERKPLSDELYEPLEWLFGEVDFFTDLPIESDENPDDYINEDQLRKSAAETLEKLRALK